MMTNILSKIWDITDWVKNLNHVQNVEIKIRKTEKKQNNKVLILM